MAQYIGVLLRSLLLLSILDVSRSEPVEVTFDGCKPRFTYGIMYDCCPTSKKPIRDFKPVFNSSRPIRIRRALQCLDEEELAEYKRKLEKAYTILNALPDDDPRSLNNQAILHCANAVVHFWNWDNDGMVVEGRSKGCTKAGNKFPSIYAHPSSPLYHQSRSWRSRVPSLPVDLGLTFDQTGHVPTESDPQLPDDVVLARNSEVMAFWFNGDSSIRTFYGRPYRAGDSMVNDSVDSFGGSFELLAHGSVHFWTHGDMAQLGLGAYDPVFFAHHGNVERLWELWMRQGPNRVPQDPDFLDSEFLFHDENADTVRVRVGDVLDTRVLGFDYEELNDASWNLENFATTF
ncbi:hypothetical protein R1sor_002103 [Riccia sorocarpa]|uniref:Tyrosinase copper-binding domain-containing protein n=1 Tax=Riccia sorocarpa TaxID=122646 RepID=A0ABD3GZG7_9MARC